MDEGVEADSIDVPSELDVYAERAMPLSRPGEKDIAREADGR